MQRPARLLLASLVLSLGLCSSASAQEQEPNNSCPFQADAGAVTLPMSFTGNLDGASVRRGSDVDFLRFSGQPGAKLSVELFIGRRLGLFDENCALVDSIDAFDRKPLEFVVPASGQFTLALASGSDDKFQGLGFFNDGLYVLRFGSQPARIGSITGRLVDAVTGAPVSGETSLQGRVVLHRCENFFCGSNEVISVPVDAQGRFRLQLDSRARPIAIGEFQLEGLADEYAGASTQFVVFEDEDFDLGDIALVPPDLLIYDVEPCPALLPQGGTCRYSARIRNNTTEPLAGRVFSSVTPFVNFFFWPAFETSTLDGDTGVRRAVLTLPPGGSQDVAFSFDVPSFLPRGSRLCTELYVGTEPVPLLAPARSKLLFCMEKQDAGFLPAASAPSEPALASVEESLLAAAPIRDAESNNSCPDAQDAGALALPAGVAGSLDAASATALTDVDFYRFSAAPGLAVRATVDADLPVGAFDDACNLITTGQGFFNELKFEVPASGQVTLAVASTNDSQLRGAGTDNAGGYALSLVTQAAIGSLTGRIVDARTREPLSQVGFQFARASLLRCGQLGCPEFVNSSETDASGRFDLTRSGNSRIGAGRFMLTAQAGSYATASVEVTVGEGEHVDVGDIALIPPALQIADLRPCPDLPLGGGTCTYSARIRNNTPAELRGSVRSLVSDEFPVETLFEVGSVPGAEDVERVSLEIPPFGSQEVTFSLDIPLNLPNNASPCVALIVGREPFPLLNVAMENPIAFCLQKTRTGVQVTPR